jgi:NADPH:quinone reductase-like Zn-dependent oxidoreductase
MQAAVVSAPGHPPQVAEFPDPVAGPDEHLVRVRAAGLHPVVKALASGSHYAGGGGLPHVPGIDGVGTLEDGNRVYFIMPRPPYGALAPLAPVPRAKCAPIPDGLDDLVAAAIVNPGLSAWLALVVRAQLVARETVLVLGATGVSGKLAVQVARSLGAGRILAAGRNPETLRALPSLGADVACSLEDLPKALAGEAVDVIVDYLWGAPTESVIAAITRKGVNLAAGRVRLVQVGTSAGPTITLRADVLRSSGLEILGSGAGSVSFARIREELPHILERAAKGELRVDIEAVPLSDIESVWQRSPSGKRLVVVPPQGS